MLQVGDQHQPVVYPQVGDDVVLCGPPPAEGEAPVEHHSQHRKHTDITEDDQHLLAGVEVVGGWAEMVGWLVLALILALCILNVQTSHIADEVGCGQEGARQPDRAAVGARTHSLLAKR